MKATYTQTNGIHGIMVAEVITPTFDERGEVMLLGFKNSQDSSNTRRAIAYAGSLMNYALTEG